MKKKLAIGKNVSFDHEGKEARLYIPETTKILKISGNFLEIVKIAHE